MTKISAWSSILRLLRYHKNSKSLNKNLKWVRTPLQAKKLKILKAHMTPCPHSDCFCCRQTTKLCKTSKKCNTTTKIKKFQDNLDTKIQLLNVHNKLITKISLLAALSDPNYSRKHLQADCLLKETLNNLLRTISTICLTNSKLVFQLRNCAIKR